MKISVCLITYNHERFISQSIDGVLKQETDFDYELVIGEDCSTDATREIVEEYRKKHPEIIRIESSDGNVGAARNFVRTYKACRGKYVATLDGDDYWTSPYKLQKQADFLDNHPYCSFCFHPVKRIFEGTDQPPVIIYPRGRRTIYKLADYAATGLRVAHCSTLFRNRLIREIPDWFSLSRTGDSVFQVLHAQRGNLGYIDELMAVHRCHSDGIGYLGRTCYGESLRLQIEFCKILSKHVSEEIFRVRLYRHYYSLAHYLLDQDQRDRARHYTQKCLKECGFDWRVTPFEPFGIYTHMYARLPYNFLRFVKRKVAALVAI